MRFTFPSLAAYASGQPSQFSIVTGDTACPRSTLFSGGTYLQDDYHIRSRMTLSYGLRLESQNHLPRPRH